MTICEYELVNEEVDELAKEVTRSENDEFGLGMIDLTEIQFVRAKRVCKKYADVRKIGFPANLFTKKKWLVSLYNSFEDLSREKKKIVMIHELLHIDLEKGKLKKHDVEDFRDIIERFGLNWETK